MIAFLDIDDYDDSFDFSELREYDDSFDFSELREEDIDDDLIPANYDEDEPDFGSGLDPADYEEWQREIRLIYCLEQCWRY